MPRPPSRTRQLLDPMAAFQMVHIMEGVIQRGTATVLRDLNRPLFGKTGTTTGPTNVWFVGGTPDIVAGVYLGYDQPRPLGGYAPGRPHRGADLQAMGADRAQGPAEGAVRRAAGHPLGARSTARAASAVFGVFPTHGRSEVVGDLGSVPAADRAAAQLTAARRRSVQPASSSSRRSAAGRSRQLPQQRATAPRQPAGRAAAAAPPRLQPPTGLPTQNAL